MFRVVVRVSLAFCAVLIWTAVHALPAQAVDFQQEADNAANAGVVELGQLSAFRDFLNRVGSEKFRHLKITNVKAHTNAITGDVTFFRVKAHILVYSGGGAKSTFIAIDPGNKLRFSDLFGPKASLFDHLPSEKEMFAFAVGDVELQAGDFPKDVRKLLAPFFPTSDFTMKVDQGINILSLTDLNKSDYLRDVLEILGGKGSKVAVHVSVEGNVLDSLLDGDKPVPDLRFSALLPPFQPHIGNKIKLPAALQFKLEGSVAANRDKADLGLVTTFKFSHARNQPPVEMELAGGVSQEEGKPPKIKIVAGMPDGKPLKHAFGVKWLTLSDYQMSFALKGTNLTIGLTGATSFGGKTIDLGGSMLVTAETEGMPIPKTLDFSVSDGPDKVGELSLLDIVRAFEYMSRESGRPVRFDEKRIPNIAIAGTGVGQGPSISLNLRGADDAGFDISGILQLLGRNVATVDRAFLDTSEGFQLTARTREIKGLGPLDFPNVAVDVAFVASKDDRTMEEPRIVLRTTNGMLFGARSSLQFVMRPSEFAFLTDQDFGSLFKFKFAAYTTQQKRFADLAKANFFMNGDLTSDPSVWIRTDGKQAVQEAFGDLTNNAAAQRTVDDLQNAIRTLNGKIDARENAIRNQRRSQQARINEARDKVNALQGDINNENGVIGRLSSEANRSCNQTKRICTWYDIFKRECTSHATVADVPARAACTWDRGKAAAQLVGAETARAALVASKTVADKTLDAVERGISLPLDLDPQVAYYLSQRDSAELSLATAQQTLREFAKAGDFLSEGTNVLAGATNGFAIKSARVQGDLRAAIDGKPVVLTLDYVFDGHPYRDRLAYSIRNAAYNAAQMKAWVLGIAVKAMTDFAHSQPLVPHKFLDQAVSEFERQEAAAHVEQEKALANLHEPGKPSGHYQTIEEAVASGHQDLSARRKDSFAKILAAKEAELNAARDRRAAPLIVNSGDLLQYTLDNGNFGALPKKIGVGWGGFTRVFAGAANRIFAINHNGAFRVYVQNSNGTIGYSKVTGSGWGGFTHVLNGPPGYVYGVTGDGNLLAYPLAGNSNFASGERQVGNGWGVCKQLFSDARNNLYCIRGNGDLWDYQMESNAAIGSAEKIGSGWTSNAAHVFAVAGGIVYLIDNQGALWYYRHAQGTDWPVTHRLAGSGWGPYARVFSNGKNVFAIRR